MAIITRDQARRHLRAQGVNDDEDLELKMAAAEAIVLHHLGNTGSPAWDGESDTGQDIEFDIVRAATLIVLGNLYRFRGDEEGERDPLEGAKAMLSPLRDPTLA